MFAALNHQQEIVRLAGDFHKHRFSHERKCLELKKQTLYRIALPVLFLLFGSLSASAQSLENLMTIQVPFDFQVGEKSLPAGKYVIKRDPQMPKLLLIQCPEQNILVAVYTITLDLPKEPARTSLTFKEYGEKHFLTEVKVQGRGVGYALTRSKAEQKLAQGANAKTIRAIPSSASRNN